MVTVTSPSAATVPVSRAVWFHQVAVVVVAKALLAAAESLPPSANCSCPDPLTVAVVPAAPDNATVTTPSVIVMLPGLVTVVVVVPGTASPSSSRTHDVHGTGEGGAGNAEGYVGVVYVTVADAPEPATFTATTETLYVVASASPLATHDPALVVALMVTDPQLAPPERLTVYDVISAPPSLAGIAHEMRAERGADLAAASSRGADATVRGIAVTSAVLPSYDVELAEVMVTICTSYRVPLLRPVNVTEPDADDNTVCVALPGHDAPDSRRRSSYRVNVPPPRSAGAVHDTVSVPSPGVDARVCTASALVTGVNSGDSGDAAPAPTELIAATVTLYAVPLVRPLIVHVVVVQESSLTAVPPATGVATSRYAKIDSPPLKLGALNCSVIAPLDADADLMTGAFASCAMIWNERVTSLAAANRELPACDALISHCPALTTDRVEPDTVHTDAVSDVNETAKPDDADADNTLAGAPKFMLLGWANVMVWFSDPTTITCWASTAAAK